MSSYWSLSFLFAFLPIIVILYNIFPKKHRAKLLLLASYAFFWILSEKLIIYILIATVITYFGGLWIDKVQNERNEKIKDLEKEKKKEIKEKYLKKQRIILTFLSLTLIGILVVLKYSGFIITNIDSIFALLKLPINIEVPKFLLPIGISFYTLQAVSYLIDVYKEKFKADRNFGRIALFLAFFPQIMEGPICRYSQTAEALWEGNKTTYKNLTFGLQRIGIGFLKKMLVVDRANGFLINAFSNYAELDGGVAFIAMITYTIQLYMDFSGTMDVVIGMGEIFGVTMPENFKQPFFSKSISDFWTRWHITLGTWFRDYIFYPVSLTNRCKKITTSARKKIGNYYGPLIASAIALFCVWICNGLWHGSAWNYIFFGMYHFALILLAKICDPLSKKVQKLLHINVNHFLYQGFQIIRTTLLVCVGELFFRAEGLQNGLKMFWKMISNFTFESLANGHLFELGLDARDFWVIGLTVVLVFILSVMKEKGINIRESISKKNIVLRWALYYALIITILIFGTYGLGYIPLNPMYANF